MLKFLNIIVQNVSTPFTNLTGPCKRPKASLFLLINPSSIGGGVPGSWFRKPTTWNPSTYTTKEGQIIIN